MIVVVHRIGRLLREWSRDSCSLIVRHTTGAHLPGDRFILPLALLTRVNYACPMDVAVTVNFLQR